MYPVRIPGLDYVNRNDYDENVPRIQFPNGGFEEFSVPLSRRNGNCRTIEEFCKGVILKDDLTDLVIKYKDLKENEVVTVVEHKKIKELDEEIKDLLREIKILRRLKHRHLLKLLDIAVEREDLTITYLVFEPMVFFLSDLIENKVEGIYEESFIKVSLRQLLVALRYLKKEFIMHRNIHPGNIALTSNGLIKITNFREARRISERDTTILSHEFRYQAPELLLTTQICGPPVDVWSVGCIFAHLLLREPLFKGNDMHSVLNDIFRKFGVPTRKIWPDFFKLPEYNYFVFFHPINRYNRLVIEFEHRGRPQPDSTMELLQRMFLYDPKRRYTAQDCLKHSYFYVEEEEGSDDEDNVPASSIDDDVESKFAALSIGSG